jgi:hypothetical protein
LAARAGLVLGHKRLDHRPLLIRQPKQHCYASSKPEKALWNHN